MGRASVAEEWETPGWPFTVEDLTSRLMSAVDLMMVEVDRCIEVGGGPYLDAMRTGERIFEVPAPCDGARPEHPLPDRWPPHLDEAPKASFAGWKEPGAALDHAEAWEVVRPWVKDPIGQPQRMFHPEGWAAGELDLVLRWDGTTRLVDSSRVTVVAPTALPSTIRCASTAGSGRLALGRHLTGLRDGTSTADSVLR